MKGSKLCNFLTGSCRLCSGPRALYPSFLHPFIETLGVRGRFLQRATGLGYFHKHRFETRFCFTSQPWGYALGNSRERYPTVGLGFDTNPGGREAEHVLPFLSLFPPFHRPLLDFFPFCFLRVNVLLFGMHMGAHVCGSRLILELISITPLYYSLR